LERGKNTPRETTMHDGFGSSQRCQKLDASQS
jgi:hypothetical protein